MSEPRNPFTTLRDQLALTGKSQGIAVRLAYCVLTAKDYRTATAICTLLDVEGGGFMGTTYTRAFKSGAFRHKHGWHYDYETIRAHAHSFLDTHRHQAHAA